MKVWNQTKGLVETIYSSYTDVLDEGVVGKLLSKIERVLINEPFESYFRSVDTKVHGLIGSLVKLEQLSSNSVTKKVNDVV